jgi:hypothetical protein
MSVFQTNRKEDFMIGHNSPIGVLALTCLLIAAFDSHIGGPADAALSTPQEGRLTSPQVVQGKVIAQGNNKSPAGVHKLLTYKLEEVDLPAPVELETRLKKERFTTALRLTIYSESIQGAYAIWLDDVSLPNVFGLGPTAIGTLIYDRSILKDGAVISVQDERGLSSLPELLRLPQSLKALIKPAREDGNMITGIHSSLRIAGPLREPLVVIEFKTSRGLPQGLNDIYYAQIGKRFFPGISCANSYCQSMALQLTAREFAELRNGDLIAISYGSGIPDHSSGFGRRLWYFGQLNKGMLDK